MGKFLFITNRYYPDVVGGAEVTVQTLAEELHRRGNSIVVVTLASTAEQTSSDINGVRVHRVVVRNVYALFGAPQSAAKRLLWHAVDIHNTSAAGIIGRILDREMPEVVSTHNLGGFGVAVWREIRRRGIRLVHTLHDYYLLCPRVTMFKQGKNCTSQCLSCWSLSIFKKSASDQVDVVIGISRFVLRTHLQRGFFPRAKSAVIYNSRVWTEPGEPTLPRHDAGAAPAPIRFGFMGRIEREKGFDVLLRSLSKVPAEEWTLTVAGRAPDPAYLGALQASYGSANVQYLGFVKPAEFYGSVDVLVVPSIWNEPLGVVAFEAMGYAVPVVVSRQGGLPEIVADSGAGWEFDADNEDDLVRVLLEVIASRAQLPRIRAAALARRRAFLPDRHANEFLAAVDGP